MRYLAELAEKNFNFNSVEDRYSSIPHDLERRRVNIINMGQLGSTVLFSLKLLGGEVIESIGILDANQNLARRYEQEMEQCCFGSNGLEVQKVECIDEDRLFDCDLLLFCAKLPEDTYDMKKYEDKQALLELNTEEIKKYADEANDWGFEGIFGVVAESSEMLCAACLGEGLDHKLIRGFDLGIMASRAEYLIRNESGWAEKVDPEEMRVFGYMGKDLIFANSIAKFDAEISKDMTRALKKVAMKIKTTGAAPYISTAVASGTYSILGFLSEEWHYSTVYLGEPDEKGAFIGIMNKYADSKTQIEVDPVPDELFHMLSRIFDRHRAFQQGRDPDAEEAAKAAEKARLEAEAAEAEALFANRERAGDTATDYANRLKKQDPLEKKSAFALRREALLRSAQLQKKLQDKTKAKEQEEAGNIPAANADAAPNTEPSTNTDAVPQVLNEAEAPKDEAAKVSQSGIKAAEAAEEPKKPMDPIAIAKARAAERRKAAQEKAESLATSRFSDPEEIAKRGPKKVIMITDETEIVKDDKLAFDEEAFVEASMEEALKKSAERTVSGTPIVGIGSGDAAAKRLMQARAARLAREEEELSKQSE